jgi:translation initiation factor 2 beta subunit (eIF-2beta)/eIF-5
MKTIVHG